MDETPGADPEAEPEPDPEADSEPDLDGGDTWQTLRLEAGPGTVLDALETALVAAGAASLTLLDAGDQPIIEPPPGATPLWDEILIDALLPVSVNAAALGEALRAAFPGVAVVGVRGVSDRDWLSAVREGFEPVVAQDADGSDVLAVVAPWHERRPGVPNVILSPGLAFGTGSHPTTAMALGWLARHAQRLPGVAIIDYGCGSGILALAAAALGAGPVLGIDNDPQAIAGANANLELNPDLAGRVRFIDADAASGDNAPPAPLLVANIYVTVLGALEGRFRELLAPGARLAMTGVLQSQLPQLVAAFDWIDLAVAERRGDWVLVEGRLPE